MEDRHGRVKVWEHGYHRLLLTPKGGFFVVLLGPPPEVGGRDVQLLFAFKDLYLCGFLYEDGCWYVFSDANLGPGIDINHHPLVRSLRYEDGYIVFTCVHIAIADLFQSYLKLVDAGHPRGIYRALYRIMVTVFEALRFVEWLTELLTIYREERENPVVDQGRDGVDFSFAFHNWSNRSNAVLSGEAEFKAPMYGFASYDPLLRYSGVVLNRAGH